MPVKPGDQITWQKWKELADKANSIIGTSFSVNSQNPSMSKIDVVKCYQKLRQKRNALSPNYQWASESVKKYAPCSERFWSRIDSLKSNQVAIDGIKFRHSNVKLASTDSVIKWSSVTTYETQGKPGSILNSIEFECGTISDRCNAGKKWEITIIVNKGIDVLPSEFSPPAVIVNDEIVTVSNLYSVDTGNKKEYVFTFQPNQSVFFNSIKIKAVPQSLTIKGEPFFFAGEWRYPETTYNSTIKKVRFTVESKGEESGSEIDCLSIGKLYSAETKNRTSSDIFTKDGDRYSTRGDSPVYICVVGPESSFTTNAVCMMSSNEFDYVSDSNIFLDRERIPVSPPIAIDKSLNVSLWPCVPFCKTRKAFSDSDFSSFRFGGIRSISAVRIPSSSARIPVTSSKNLPEKTVDVYCVSGSVSKKITTLTIPSGKSESERIIVDWPIIDNWVLSTLQDDTYVVADYYLPSITGSKSNPLLSDDYNNLENALNQVIGGSSWDYV